MNTTPNAPQTTDTAEEEPYTPPRRERRKAGSGPTNRTGTQRKPAEQPAAGIDWAAHRATSWYGGPRQATANKLGFYDPATEPIPSSTRQGEATYLAVASAPTSYKGLLVGVDADTGWMVAHDPFTGYKLGITQSPNVCFIGDLGKGKSSMMKCWGVLRALVLGHRVVQIDKKPQLQADGSIRGEYTELGNKLGASIVRFALDGTGTRINILDPAIAVRIEGNIEAGKPPGQSQLLRAILGEALGRPIKPKEGKALRMAHESALNRAKAEGRVAVIGDIVHFLWFPEESVTAVAGLTVKEARKWGIDPAAELERLIEDDLAGLIDGPTSENISLNSGLTIFDVSALPEDGPALGIVMMIISTWLTNTLMSQKNLVPTHFNVEEAWHLVEGSFAKVNLRNMKVSRGLSLSCKFAFHHPSDLPAKSPARAIMKECGTVFLYGQQDDDDARDTARIFSLPKGTHKIIKKLGQGVCLLKIGTQPPLMVTHIRSNLEIELTNTDGAMTSAATIAMDGTDTTVSFEDGSDTTITFKEEAA
ncbi:hypothetical protein ABH924_004341 [Arthrobacter sp. GAS37]|uniref:ATP/GTP-binding protein n=1 Tax=Arthrobacter sp. GAS37 TaxID=3156261 RepID=UPI0038376A7F